MSRAITSRDLRRLTWLVGAAVLIDTTFYAIVAPLLPGLSHRFHLTQAGAGLLTAAYPAGMLLASLPGAVLAVRLGPRACICLGLGLLVVATVAFALLGSAPGLVGARFLEGVGGACSWDGGLAWLVVVAPAERRGAVIGQAVSAAIGGSVAGPAVGALAAALGRPALFCALAALALALAGLTAGLPVGAGAATTVTPGTRAPGAALVALVRRPLGAASLWLMALPALVAGSLTVLGSLGLHRLGAGAGVIGATFLIAAVLEIVLSAWSGRVSDQHGRLGPLAGSLGLAGTVLLGFGLAHGPVVLIAVIGLASLAIGAAWTPVMALMSDLSEASGLNQAYAAALMNVAWAAGQIAGSGGGGALARLWSATGAMAVVAVLCLLTGGVLAARRGPGGG